MKRSKRERAGKAHARPAKLTERDLAIPIALALVLSASGLALGYFWDDFYFLTGALADPLAYVRPTAGATFYRPIPQGLYFLLLSRLGSWGALAGHVINAAVLALSTFLLGRLATRLVGRKGGLFAAIAFGTLGAVPTLVVWTSCSQDLFAIAFFLGALHMRDRGRTLSSGALALAALLSKETVVALFPVLVLWDWLVGRKPARILSHALLVGIPVLLWAAIHPGIRALFAFGFRSGVTGYVGLEHPERWAGYAFRYLMTLLNVPSFKPPTSWPVEHTLEFVGAMALLLAWFYARRRSLDAEPAPDRASLDRVVRLGALLAVPPILMAAVLVRRWNPYFACLPALGTSLVLGAFAATLPLRRAAVLLAAFLFLGVWSRGLVDPNPEVFTESDCRNASFATRLVEARFLRVQPTMARGSNVLVNVGTTDKQGIMGTLLDNQALRIWYHDPTLTTIRPERRRRPTPTEYLFRVSSDLEVIGIDPDRGAYRVLGAPPDDPTLVGRSIRNFARGIAASGDGDRGIRILEGTSKIDGSPLSDYDKRLSAMIRYAQGRSREAESLKAVALQFDRETSINMVGKLLDEPTGNAALDSMALPAFGVSPDDTVAVRKYMRMAHGAGAGDRATAFAERFLRLVPGDGEATAILREEARRKTAIQTSGPNAVRTR